MTGLLEVHLSTPHDLEPPLSSRAALVELIIVDSYLLHVGRKTGAHSSRRVTLENPGG
jgi:hypothetical protein